MNILFLTENFPPESNAAATRVYERACYWADWGHRVTVITSAPNFPEGKLFPGFENKWKQSETMSGIRVVRVKTFIAANRGVLHRTLDFLSFMASGFIAAIREPVPDVIVATSPQFFTAVAGWAAAAVRGVPFVFELGDLWPASIAAVGAIKKSPALSLIEKVELFLYRRSAAIAALTGSFRDNLVSRGIDGAKISVVMNGVDLARYGPRRRDMDMARQWGLADKFVVGYVGTHGMAHALGNVLDAAELLKGDDNIRILLAGAGAERDALIAGAGKRGLANVVFMPRQPKERMPAVWSLCDIALVHLKDSPVFSGVIPSKIFEAEAMGLPLLLAAPAGEASRIVLGDGAGLHVPPENPAALAAAIVRLAGDRAAREKFSAAALAAAPGHSRQTQAREMLDVLQSAADGKGPKP